MHEIARLVADVQRARRDYLSPLLALSTEQGAWAPSESEWSIAGITEHLFRAEQGGVSLIWDAADGRRRGKPAWEGETIHRGKSIERIVEETWEARAIAPESARPSWGGPLSYWVAALRNLAPMLEDLVPQLDGLDLESVVHPHPISGPLDARQRLEFLRFHIDRHRAQAARVMAGPGFPSA